jgi:hypothetical protein
VVLKRLEEETCLDSFAESQKSRPPKRMFNLTSAGKKAFLEWLSTPVEHVRDFRIEFLGKMFFFDHLSLPGAKDLVEMQIRVLEKLLDKLRKLPGEEVTGFMKLAYGFKVRNVECLLSWLRQEARPFAKKKTRGERKEAV